MGFAPAQPGGDARLSTNCFMNSPIVLVRSFVRSTQR
jgi:hypothetical protein